MRCRQQIADGVGTSRETVTRVVKDLSVADSPSTFVRLSLGGSRRSRGLAAPRRLVLTGASGPPVALVKWYDLASLRRAVEGGEGLFRA